MKTTKPFFSIIIPTLNEEEYLPRLLKSILQQTEKSFEVLVVDGISEDATVARAQEFVDKMPLKIVTTKVRNVSVQRNLGGKHAQGKYLVFLDADVQTPKGFLKTLKKDLEKELPPFATTRLKADSTQVYDLAIVRLLNLTMQLALLVDRPFVGGYNFIVERNVFHTLGGFREDIWHAEDYDFSIRLYKSGYTLAILKRPYIIYSLRRFRHEGRLTVLGKNAQAALHVFTKGPIKQEIFSYPMGGLWYKLKEKEQIRPAVLKTIEKKVKKWVSLFLED